jgi:hypothetical protein
MTELQSVISEIFTDNKYRALPHHEKYKMCTNILVVQPLSVTTPLLHDSLYWRGILASSLGLEIQHDTVSEFTLSECLSACNALREAGHAQRQLCVNNNQEKLEHYRILLKNTFGKCDESMGGNKYCDAYLLFNTCFVTDYGGCARHIVSDYHAARCSNLCQRQASPLYRCFGDTLFCSDECRQHYLRVLGDG